MVDRAFAVAVLGAPRTAVMDIDRGYKAMICTFCGSLQSATCGSVPGNYCGEVAQLRRCTDAVDWEMVAPVNVAEGNHGGPKPLPKRRSK